MRNYLSGHHFAPNGDSILCCRHCGAIATMLDIINQTAWETPCQEISSDGHLNDTLESIDFNGGRLIAAFQKGRKDQS